MHLTTTDTWQPPVPGRAPAGAPVPARFVSRDLLSSFCKDFRSIAGATLLTFCATCGVVLVLKPHYVADATLLVLLSPDYASRQVAGMAPGSGEMLDRDAFLKSELDILTSRSLEETAVSRIGADTLYPGISDPSWLERARQALFGGPAPDPQAAATGKFALNFDAAADKTGNILNVSFRNRDPAVAANAVNTMIALYLEKRHELYSDVQSQALAQQAADLRRQLESAEQALSDFKAKSGILNYATQRDLLLHQRDDLTRDLQAGDSAAAQASESRAAAEAQLNHTTPDVVTQDEVDTRRQAELAAVGAQITGSTVRHGRNTVYESLNLDRARAAISLQAAHARHDADVQQLAEVQDRLVKLEASGVELDRLERARATLDASYQTVAKALADRQLVEDVDAKKASNVRIIQAAEPPAKPTNTRLVVFAAGVLLSLFMGALVAVLSNLFRRGYIAPETLERRLGVPVLASIPDLGGVDRDYGRLSNYGPAD
jgi:uncharacterized protein involved in exopolysaccharide biosynthesis